ncbi:MAG: NAD-dependent epimerase/dehydratase family protein [Candidatus Omnitrophica bacterium]|nr:NAD-dependent epimerase/dehydratase family protein [Candidatus Omnitrophota bacterium]
MAKKKVYLITGATGFIGSCLLRKLIAKNENTHVLLRKQASLWRIRDLLRDTNIHFSDLSDVKSLSKIVEKIKPDIIYHLATYGAYSFQNDVDLCVKTNITGTWNLLKTTSKIDYELFVNTGSSSEYGFKKSPMAERDSLEPASYYAVTKCSQTLLCSYFAKEYRKPIVTLRPFSVYGPYEDKGRFVPTLLKALYLHNRMNLVSPNISRDWIYIDDIVDAYLLVNKLKNYSGEVFNIGTGVQKTIKQIVVLAFKVTNEECNLRWNKMKNRKWDTGYWLADISKANKLLRWDSRINLYDGLSLTWEWFKRNLSHYS